MNNIEILEKLVERCKECKFACCEQCEINNIQVKAIENLLLELKGIKIDLKLQETENENLIKENKELKKENLELHKEINQRIKLKLENERCADKDFIPKSKVKEKIEQLKFVKNTPVKDNKYTYKECIEYGIEELQELLEEGE